MATTLAEIYDIFMMQVTDYRLTALFNTSETDFENFLQAWLDHAIVDFSICDQDLDFDDDTKLFPVVLTRKNKIVLATLMKKWWMEKNVNDVTQMNLHITDRDFKVASEAQNLREKMAALNSTRETCSQMLVDYGYSNVAWADWYAGDTAGL